MSWYFHIWVGVKAMMDTAHVPDKSREKVALEALKCTTIPNGLQLVTTGDKVAMHYEHVYTKNPRWVSNLRTWDKAGVVKEGNDNKTGDKGKTMMFIGYPVNQDADSARMSNPHTNRVVMS